MKNSLNVGVSFINVAYQNEFFFKTLNNSPNHVVCFYEVDAYFH